VREIPVHLANGTGLTVSPSVRVFRACSHGELLGALGALFGQVHRSPWAELALELDEDLVRFYRDAFKVHLCSALLAQGQLDNIGAIVADCDTNVGQVLHELVWYDWFYDMPLSHVLDECMKYGILIVPSGQGVWHMNEAEPGFQMVMGTLHTPVGASPYSLPLRHVPRYLAMQLENEMEIYDSTEGLDQWLTSHTCMVIQRDPVY